jgi:hypothetical protein
MLFWRRSVCECSWSVNTWYAKALGWGGVWSHAPPTFTRTNRRADTIWEQNNDNLKINTFYWRNYKTFGGTSEWSLAFTYRRNVIALRLIIREQKQKRLLCKVVWAPLEVEACKEHIFNPGSSVGHVPFVHQTTVTRTDRYVTPVCLWFRFSPNSMSVTVYHKRRSAQQTW